MRAIFFILITLLPTFLYAQKSDCKFKDFKVNATGKTIQMTRSNSKVGMFFVGKNGDNFMVMYTRQGLFDIGAERRNTTVLRVDSVRFVFSDHSKLTFKTVGTGTVVNSSAKLKPDFETIGFSFEIDPKNLSNFTEKKSIGFMAYGEKSAEAGDMLNEKQGESFIKAFNCFK